MNTTHVKLKVEDINKILVYLQNQPFKDVHALVNLILASEQIAEAPAPAEVEKAS
jgi:hypothetical protein